ncbi:hypothetical protein ACRAWF_36150 [Streptomyces sp. L7]
MTRPSGSGIGLLYQVEDDREVEIAAHDTRDTGLRLQFGGADAQRGVLGPAARRVRRGRDRGRR